MVKRLYEPFATSALVAPQLAARFKQREHAGGNDTLSDRVSSCGASDLWRSSSKDKRPRAFAVLQFLKSFYVESLPL